MSEETGQMEIGRVALLGANGMLGRAWRELLGRAAIAFDAGDLPGIDVRDQGAIDRFVTEAHTHVVNCAAWTDVDGAEADEAGAHAINAAAPGLLARVCAERGVRVVHYSTDYVFGGTGDGAWTVDAPRSPINAYARTKAAGEDAIERAGGDWMIVRTSWLYAPWGKNFVRTIARLARERESLRVVDDQVGRPTSAEHLARVTLELMRRGVGGTWHVTDGGSCSWHGFASEIVRGLGLGCRVEACTSEEFPRPARRPANSVLDLSRTEALLGQMPHWRENLAVVLATLEE